MEIKEIIVTTLTEMVKAIELNEAELVIVKGMIYCGRYRFNLRSKQAIVGYDENSGLQFRYDEASSAISLNEGSRLEKLKLEVVAEKYPDQDRMQAVVEVNGYQALLKNIRFDINIKALRAEEYKQYSGIYPRHEVLLSGNLYIRCRGHHLVPIAYCPLSTSRFVGNGVTLCLEGGRLDPLRQLDLRGENNIINLKTAAR